MNPDPSRGEPMDDGFPTPAAIRQAGGELGLSTGSVAALIDGLALFDRHPHLRTQVVQLCRACCDRTAAPSARPEFPPPPSDPSPWSELFHAYVVIAGYRDAIAWNQQRGIPPEVTRAAFSDLERWMEDYRRVHGRPGFDRLGWLWLHLQGRLHELGRLQFERASWEAPVIAVRHRQTHAVALLMTAGQAMRPDGRHQGIAGSPVLADGFTTILESDGTTWRGHRVTAHGVAEPTASEFPVASWEVALTPGDPVLSLHIPAGGGLTPATCAASCQEALRFHAAHFPEHRFKAITSASWMFDPQLSAALPADSNLVRFQSAFHLHPHPDRDGHQIRERVLGRSDADIASFVPRTTLQRIVIDHLRGGGLWCQHGAVLFPDEIPLAFGL